MTALVAAAVVVAAISTGHADATAVTVKGDRLVVMTIGEFFANPQWPAAVEAHVAALNRAGGIEDAAGATHLVKVIVCDTKADPSEAQRCAQRAVDQHVVAVVGMSALDSDAIWPVLEAAGIPVIGSHVNTERDATSPVAFPLAAGIVGMFSAMPQLLVRQGAHKVAVVVSDFGDATDSALALIRSGLSLTTAATGPVVRVPLEATDLAPYAAAADREGVDGVIAFIAGDGQAALLKALRTLRYQGAVVTQASLSITGSPAVDEGTLGVGEFPPVTARVKGMQRFRQDMLDAGISSFGSLGPLEPESVNYWLAAWVFERVARGLPDANAKSVLEALSRVEKLDMGGITPPLSTTPAKLPYPRLFNPTVTLNSVENGKVTRLSGGFLDPLTGDLR